LVTHDERFTAGWKHTAGSGNDETLHHWLRSIPPRRVPETYPDEKINKKSKRSFAERAITIGRERTTGKEEYWRTYHW
jgi:hypothetical protein